MSLAYGLAVSVLWPPVCALITPSLMRLLRMPPGRVFDPVAWPWLVASVIDLCAGILTAEWLPVAVSVVQAGIAVAIWRRRNGRRKRADASIGAKSLARLAALVRRAREVARPRPVLRPAPGGAR